MTQSIVLRGLKVGDIGWVAHRQGILYAQEYGWDGRFEALVAEIAAQFVKNFDPVKENAWIAECDGRVVGSVFLVKVSDAEAKLRLLYVEPEVRGTGLGRRLTQECIAFARARGYPKLSL
jgi:predicted N-acetyltransferase YhbS